MGQLTPHDGRTPTVFRRLLMGKATEQTRKAYANGFGDFAQFLEIEPVSGAHPLASVPDTMWPQTTHHPAILHNG